MTPEEFEAWIKAHASADNGESNEGVYVYQFGVWYVALWNDAVSFHYSIRDLKHGFKLGERDMTVSYDRFLVHEDRLYMRVN